MEGMEENEVYISFCYVIKYSEFVEEFNDLGATIEQRATKVTSKKDCSSISCTA